MSETAELIEKIFSEECIVLHPKARSKTAAIRELMESLHQANRVVDFERALQAVMDRENRMSTGMQNGLAIPHGKTKGVEDVVAALGVFQDGVDFDCIDGQPAHIIVLAVSAPTAMMLHIQFLAAISKILNRAEIRDAVMDATNPGDALQVLIEAAKG